MRLPSYEFPKEVQVELQEAIEDIRMVLNNGRYVQTVTGTEPSYVGSEGEFVIHDAGALKYAFFYADGGWHYVQLTAGPLP